MGICSCLSAKKSVTEYLNQMTNPSLFYLDSYLIRKLIFSISTILSALVMVCPLPIVYIDETNNDHNIVIIVINPYLQANLLLSELFDS
jgi:hypothetical protein